MSFFIIIIFILYVILLYSFIYSHFAPCYQNTIYLNFNQILRWIVKFIDSKTLFCFRQITSGDFIL